MVSWILAGMPESVGREPSSQQVVLGNWIATFKCESARPKGKNYNYKTLRRKHRSIPS